MLTQIKLGTLQHGAWSQHSIVEHLDCIASAAPGLQPGACANAHPSRQLNTHTEVSEITKIGIVIHRCVGVNNRCFTEARISANHCTSHYSNPCT